MKNEKIKISNLTTCYKEQKILNNISFAIEKGSFSAIAGPNGAGKSTFLKALIKMIKSNKNSIFVDDVSIDLLNQKQLAKKISMVPQNGKTEASLSVRETVQLGRYVWNDMSKVDQAMETVGIMHLADRIITKISGGEFQMVMLARAICQDAPIIVLDEPVNSLDLWHQLRLLSLLEQLRKEQGKTIICVLHDLNTILHWCTDIFLINKGSLYNYGKPSDILVPKTIKEVFNVDSKLITVQETGKKHLIFQEV